MNDSGERFRQTLPESRRVVVKIGSKVLVDDSGKPSRARISALVKDCAQLHKSGYEIVLVSSGAIASGMEALHIASRPTEVPDLQTCAAVGQVRLMGIYSAAFAKHGIIAGQLLLTHDDFARKLSVANMRRTMDDLLRRKVVPVVNENDAVADEEVKAYMSLGDNDHLASLVARQTRSDLLIMLSSVDGLRKNDGRKNIRVPFVDEINKSIVQLVKPPEAGAISKGGMDSKLKATAACMQAGCNVVIADGRKKGVLSRILAGEDEGTLFAAVPM